MSDKTNYRLANIQKKEMKLRVQRSEILVSESEKALDLIFRSGSVIFSKPSLSVITFESAGDELVVLHVIDTSVINAEIITSSWFSDVSDASQVSISWIAAS